MKNGTTELKLRTWVEIDRKAAEKNYKVFRSVVSPKTKLMAVVKSNAYGNELVGFSKIMDELGADIFGVDSITEGVALRDAGIKKPILVLGYTIPENFKVASENDLSVTISSFELLNALKKNTSPIKVHIKLDTGMHRQGFSPKDARKIIHDLLLLPHVSMEGVYTHFAKATDPFNTKAQADAFFSATVSFDRAGFHYIKHACASAGTLLYPECHFDMVRVGIGLHGLWPAKEVKDARSGTVKIEPVLSWKTILSEVKKVKKGERVGYDLTETLKKDSCLGVCPVGYWHGFTRALSGVGEVLVRGKRARVIGRVAMDMIAIDITDIPSARAGDEVVLIGKQGRDRISAEEMAERSGTINYEVTTRINPKIRRVFK